jgi:hypothetical protein
MVDMPLMPTTIADDDDVRTSLPTSSNNADIVTADSWQIMEGRGRISKPRAAQLKPGDAVVGALERCLVSDDFAFVVFTARCGTKVSVHLHKNNAAFAIGHTFVEFVRLHAGKKVELTLFKCKDSHTKGQRGASPPRGARGALKSVAEWQSDNSVPIKLLGPEQHAPVRDVRVSSRSPPPVARVVVLSPRAAWGTSLPPPPTHTTETATVHTSAASVPLPAAASVTSSSDPKLRNFLSTLGLERLLPTFAKEEIDLAVLHLDPTILNDQTLTLKDDERAIIAAALAADGAASQDSQESASSSDSLTVASAPKFPKDRIAACESYLGDTSNGGLPLMRRLEALEEAALGQHGTGALPDRIGKVEAVFGLGSFFM